MGLFLNSTKNFRNTGQFYTPSHLSQLIIWLAFQHYLQNFPIRFESFIKSQNKDIQSNIPELMDKLQNISILDLGVGDGAFILAAGKYLEKLIQISNNEDPILNRVNILEHNLYGVDNNPNAIHICHKKLQEWLLGNRSKSQVEYKRSRKLVCDKVRLGNVLFGNISSQTSDFISKNLSYDELDGIQEKPFHWYKNFPRIFSQESQGFDIVLSNPPYVTKNISPELIRLYRFLYGDSIFVNRFNLYHIFFIRVKDILAPNGIAVFLTANSILTDAYSAKVRDFIFSNFDILAIVDFVSRTRIFPKVLQGLCILVIRKKSSLKVTDQTNIIRTLDMASIKQGQFDQAIIPTSHILCHNKFISSPYSKTFEIINHLKENTTPLDNIFKIQSGEIRPADKNLHGRYFKRIPPSRDKKEFDIVLNGKNIAPYVINLSENRQKPRWYLKPKSKEEKLFRHNHSSSSRLVFQRITAREQLRRIIAGKVDNFHLTNHQNIWVENNVNYILADSKSISPNILLGIFNSLLINWYLHQINLTASIPPTDLGILPFPTLKALESVDLDFIGSNVISIQKLLRLYSSSSEIFKELCPICNSNNEVNQLRSNIDNFVFQVFSLSKHYQKEILRQLYQHHSYFNHH